MTNRFRPWLDNKAFNSRREKALSRNTSKFAHEVLANVLKSSLTAPEKEKEIIVRKAFCPRLANSTKVISASVFSFDKNGVCPLILDGRADKAENFDLLLRMPGIEEIFDAPKVVSKPVLVIKNKRTTSEEVAIVQELPKAEPKEVVTADESVIVNTEQNVGATEIPVAVSAEPKKKTKKLVFSPLKGE